MLNRYEVLVDLVKSVSDWGTGCKVDTGVLLVEAPSKMLATQKAKEIISKQYPDHEDYLIKNAFLKKR